MKRNGRENEKQQNNVPRAKSLALFFVVVILWMAGISCF